MYFIQVLCFNHYEKWLNAKSLRKNCKISIKISDFLIFCLRICINPVSFETRQFWKGKLKPSRQCIWFYVSDFSQKKCLSHNFTDGKNGCRTISLMETMLVVLLSYNFLFYGILRNCTISIFSINESCTISIFVNPGSSILDQFSCFSGDG